MAAIGCVLLISQGDAQLIPQEGACAEGCLSIAWVLVNHAVVPPFNPDSGKTYFRIAKEQVPCLRRWEKTYNGNDEDPQGQIVAHPAYEVTDYRICSVLCTTDPYTDQTHPAVCWELEEAETADGSYNCYHSTINPGHEGQCVEPLLP